jgi:hypothetical protein
MDAVPGKGMSSQRCCGQVVLTMLEDEWMISAAATNE